MSDTPYSPLKPPKTITRIQDDTYLDFRKKYTWSLLIFAFIVIGLIYYFGIVEETVYKVSIIVLLVAFTYTWLRYFSTPEKVDKYLLSLSFQYQDFRGNNVINKFDAEDPILNKIIPIVNIHPGGIIEFKDKKYGVLLQTNPKRISDEEREAHEKKIEKVVNGIPANTHFKTIACSRLQPRKPIQQYLLDVSNKSTGKKATDQHLASLYTKVAEDGTPVISWKYYAFQSLGEQSSLDAARIQYGAVVPGLLKNMKGAKLNPRIYEDAGEIVDSYRTMFGEMLI